MRKCLGFFLLISPFFVNCTSAPPPDSAPFLLLEFDHIEAKAVDNVTLHYWLKAENTHSLPLNLELRNWKCLLNGIPLDAVSAALSQPEAAAGMNMRLDAGDSGRKALVLKLNLQAVPENFGTMPEDEYLADLILRMNAHYGNNQPFGTQVSAVTAFPRIRKPEFTIGSIAILQADLVNIRFKVRLRIDNPNVFPLSLSSLDYKVFGDDRFWAGGNEQDVLFIPGVSFAETSLTLSMNFIDMHRQLLDEIIAMEKVRYRFTGAVEVATGVSWLPVFRMEFDRRGDSAVLK
jgi:LEA14-like dessication related protein